MTRRIVFCLIAGGLAGLLWPAAGCEVPVEPGSDLPDSSQPAQLGPNIDVGRRGDVRAREGADVTGSFDLQARVSSPMGGGPMDFPLIAIFEQSGELNAGGATLAVELRSPQASDEPGARTEMPADVSQKGEFRATIPEFTVPASVSDIIEEDARAGVAMDGQIIDSNCVEGDITITMRDVELTVSPNPIPELKLEGPFAAERQDSPGCAGGAGMSDGMDTGSMNGMGDAGAVDAQ